MDGNDNYAGYMFPCSTSKEGLSIKSKIPPIPGSREPESLMARLRLTRDLKKFLDMEKLKNEKVQAQYDELEVSYTNLKTATAITLHGSDVKETKLSLIHI